MDMQQLNEYIESKLEEKTSKIQELENEINKMKPVTLYSGSAQNNFTLEQSIDNFKTIEIIYTQSSSRNGVAKFYMKTTPDDLKSGVALNAFSQTDSGTNVFMQLFSCKLTINGTNAVRSTKTYAANNYSNWMMFDTVNGTGNIAVKEVKGYYY